MTLQVLIVDDHAGFRAVARLVLEAGGFQVSGEASSGREALAAVAAHRPDVVLLDVQLTDVSGFTVSRELRLTAPGVRVVLCSVRAAGDYGGEVTRCGAAGFLPKGRFSAALLRRILDEG
jgi:two-component system, chemotaxis family, chemotaxis protein CheY